jgi:fluoride exporter
MTEFIAVALGGAAGAVFRYLSGFFVIRFIGRSEVLNGTVLSNLLGCFFAGMALAWITNGTAMSIHIILFITIGILGSLTTFSTFALEAFQLMKKGTLTQLAAYMSAQVIAAFLLTAAGFWLINTIGVS